ncbi:MarC family protein [bacterium]|nr:MarC family protein [bacterium]NUN46314.1 NAAT family transporter [bacterium]
MYELIAFGLLCFTSFFSVINPLGVMPVFLTMTADLDAAHRNSTARKAVLVAFISMVGFALSGQLLFKFFGISVDSFRVVGGVIFFMMGYEMLQARLSRVEIDEESVKSYVEDISITPLGIPMICGPGAITTSIVLMEDAKTFEMKAVLLGVILLICLITLIGLLGASRFVNILGETGNKILMRLMGLIIMVIAVEFFFAGIKPFVVRMMQTVG